MAVFRDWIRALCAFVACALGCLSLSAEGATGDKVWEFQTGDVIFGSTALDSAGTLYLGSRDKRVYAVGSDGKLKWSFLAGDWVDSSPTLSLDEATVYFGSWDNKLYAVNAATGAKRWEFATGNLIVASPAIDQQGNLYFGSSDGFFYSITSQGTLRWSYYVGEEMDSSPAVADDGTVYVGAYDGILYSFNPDGTVKWAFTTDAPNNSEDWRIKSPPTIGATGEIYFGGGNGIVYALSPQGAKLWSFTATDKVDTGIAIDLQGRLVFGCRDGSVYCLDQNGVLEWESYVGDVFYSTPSIDSLGRVAVGSYLGNGVSGVTSINADGSIAWEYLTLDYIDSSPVFDGQGRMIFGCYDGVLYAVEAGATQAQTPWSRFGGDAFNRSEQNAVGEEIIWSSGYTTWTQSYGLFGTAANPDSDEDGDGLELAIEYLCGGDPKKGDPSPLAIATRRSGNSVALELEFVRLKDEGSIMLAIDLSTDLKTWQTLSLDAPELGLEVVDPDPLGDGKRERVRARIEGMDARFARLHLAELRSP